MGLGQGVEQVRHQPKQILRDPLSKVKKIVPRSFRRNESKGSPVPPVVMATEQQQQGGLLGSAPAGLPPLQSTLIVQQQPGQSVYVQQQVGVPHVVLVAVTLLFEYYSLVGHLVLAHLWLMLPPDRVARGILSCSLGNAQVFPVAAAPIPASTQYGARMVQAQFLPPVSAPLGAQPFVLPPQQHPPQTQPAPQPTQQTPLPVRAQSH